MRLGERATACKHGHAYDERNTYIDPKGKQRCRKCNVKAVQRWMKRHGRRS